MKPQKKNYYVTMGMVIGIPLGIPLGLAIGNLTIGPPLGMMIGAVVGLILENKYNKVPLAGVVTALPKKLKIISVILGLVVLFMGLAFLFYLLDQ